MSCTGELKQLKPAATQTRYSIIVLGGEKSHQAATPGKPSEICAALF